MSSLVFLLRLCAGGLKNKNNNNNHDNIYGAFIMTKVIARVHPIHLMNVDYVVSTVFTVPLSQYSTDKLHRVP